MNKEKLKNITYVLQRIVDAIYFVEDEKIKNSLIESAKETIKEILGLLA